MERKEFLAVLKGFINDYRQIISKLECSNHLDQVDTDKMNNIKEVFDKLEQDYFHLPADMSFENIKEFDEDGNLIKKEKTTTEQVEEGLLKLFHKYVETVENNIENYILDDNNYITSLCPIVDRLLKIESDKKLSEEYFKN